MTSEEFLTTIVPLLIGFLGMPLIQFLKSKLNIESHWALLLTYAVSIVLGIAALFVSGEIALVDFTFENIMHVTGLIITAATAAYKLLVSFPKEE